MDDRYSPWLGYLDWQSIVPLKLFYASEISEVIAGGAGSVVVLGAIALVVLLTAKRWWGPLWKDWLTSLDHKKIGIMYIVIAVVMLARAIIEAVLMRGQQAMAIGEPGLVSAEHFAELFSTHGTIMIFFMAMPFLTGLINYVMPLQIGARDVSFPLLNAISLMLTAAGAGLVMLSLVFGQFSTGGWTSYPPYTGIEYSPGVGVDYWIWAVTLSGLGSTLTGLNFAVTIYRNRAPGMTMMRMPLFTWTTLCTSILMIFAMAPLTVSSIMLALDRYAEFHFFTADSGGNLMNYANLFWLFGHPEVYILILPAFGVYSEVVSTYSGKTIYGYTSLVIATMVIAVLSFTVWLHHFFTMGQSANVNAAFGIATMLIGVPTGVKVFNWLFTMFRGRIRFTTAMLFSIMFLVTFVIGGIAGIMLANPPVDYMVHNSLFLVAHFHNMLIPGFLFGMIAAVQYWFPKAFGFRLNETWGRISFACWSGGFLLAFMPLYALGLMGAMRRTAEWFHPDYAPYLYVAFCGALLILTGFFTLIIQMIVSIRNRDSLRTPGGDAWDGRSLEWSVSSPPPEYNFPVTPTVQGRDEWSRSKGAGTAYKAPEEYSDIHLPKNSGAAPVIGVGAILLGFALVWHVWWLVIVSFVLCWIPPVWRSFRPPEEKVIPAEVVRKEHEQWLNRVQSLPAIGRERECTSANQGRAEFAG